MLKVCHCLHPAGAIWVPQPEFRLIGQIPLLQNLQSDYLKLGVAFVEFLFNADGSQIVGVNAINSKYCRLTVANKDGVVENCIVSGRFPDTPSEGEYTVYEVLDEYDPFADLERRRWAGQTNGKSFVMCIRDSWSYNEYYSAPLWFAAYLAG